MSKIEQARKIYAANADKSRLEIIDILQAQLGLARGTAAGYHDSCKKAALKAGPIPSKESWAAVTKIAETPPARKNDEEWAAFDAAPKLSAPPTEMKSAIVAATAKAAGIEVIDIPASKPTETALGLPKFKNIASTEHKPLHNFTTAEMLEVLDPKTRKDVEAFLSRTTDARSQNEGK